ncbi:hypothetical protein HOU79_gp27 [Vibrio phage 1.224.A._10N.261.48.B1]|uniref:Uncharacterized protein n=2 Tax=Mukerjeevirus TaxID=2733146 RepID=A0A2I7REL4_9CAUD|nr:hypothetical protein HOU76_gp60 [Vibrio phage 1.169.O._10N.261.52.B1]YP_009817679.1 hypothetical protein HOU79_gp27 [Vibrio phage 1.224.A._10N.261.48.B1]AUR92067.1 hypothetical protein NVP1169O_39 [Vibrio phage 1.169.O._10N.261.52.B1]AUR96446.1 hypothetical protein NVP1224A_79 [Vibrio phage 1.224.A._10N.261.48.B1]
MPIKTENLGYSEILKKDLEIEYYWTEYTTSTGVKIDALNIKPKHRSLWGHYPDIYMKPHVLFAKTVNVLRKRYRVEGESND